LANFDDRTQRYEPFCIWSNNVAKVSTIRAGI